MKTETITETTPSISSLSPNTGQAGTHVTITMTNMGNATKENTVVDFGSYHANIREIDTSSNEIKVVAPFNISTSVKVVVTIGGNASNSQTYTYQPTPKFLTRDNLTDDGGNSEGTICVSPDIMCTGETASMTLDKAIFTYSVRPWASITTGSDNYFYIRGKNISGSSLTADVKLFYSPCSLLLTPESWQEIGTSPHSFVIADNNETIANNDICYTDHPFTFKGLPTGGHVCLVAVSSINGLTYPIPKRFQSNAHLDHFVRKSPNVAQRNIFFQPVSGNVGSITVTLGNNNPKHEMFDITLTQNGSAANYPSKTTVSGQISGTYDGGKPFSKTFPSQNWTSTGIAFPPVSIPGNITGSQANPLLKLTITVTLPSGSSFADTNPLTVTYLQYPSSDSRYHEIESTALRDIEVPSYDNPGTMETKSLILLGVVEYNMS